MKKKHTKIKMFSIVFVNDVSIATMPKQWPQLTVKNLNVGNYDMNRKMEKEANNMKDVLIIYKLWFMKTKLNSVFVVVVACIK